MPSRCIFFFSTLRAWSTLLSRTRTCTRRSSSIERLMDPMAKAPEPLAHGYAQFGCHRHPRYEPTPTFEIVPADGHHGCQLEETETSVRRRFLGSSSGTSVLACLCQ